MKKGRFWTGLCACTLSCSMALSSWSVPVFAQNPSAKAATLVEEDVSTVKADDVTLAADDISTVEADDVSTVTADAAVQFTDDEAVQTPVSAFPGDPPGACGVLDKEDHFTDSLTYTITDGTLMIRGEGPMGEMMHREPWEDEAESIRSIVIGSGVTTIGFGAFRYLPNLTSVTIPATVQRIGSFAFQECQSLREVHIEASVVGEAAFIHCRNLERVYFGSGVTAIGVSAFEDCPNITGVYITDVASWCSIYFGGNNANPLEQNHLSGNNHLYLNGEEIIHLDIPASVTKIDDFSFYCAKHIRSVNIPSSVTEIGEYAFFRNEALERVTGAESVAVIGTQAFEGDIKLVEMPFPAGLRRIGPYAFRYAPLTSVTMHSGEIGKYAFDGCGNLTTLNLGAGIRVGENAFRGCPATVPADVVNVVNAYRTVEMGYLDDQPIEWIVLEEKDGRALLLSKYILSFPKFHKYTSPSKAHYNWGNSSLREYLNQNFYRDVFSGLEKEDILTSTVDADDNPVFGTKDVGATVSRIHILSATELERYFPNSEDRMASRIPSARAINPNTGERDSAEEHPYLNTSYYWVRTPGLFTYSECYVHYTGKIMYDGQSKANWIVGLRPAMWVKAEAVDDDASTERVTEFVTRLYQLCLGREPDSNGLSNWVSALTSGQYTAAKAVKGFFMSKEMEALGLSDEEFVDRCYRVMMSREPDVIGKRQWVSVLNEGCSRLLVLKGFVGSEEFARICLKYKVEQGTVELEPRDRNLWVTRFVIRCYTTVLGRNYDVSGLNAWTSVILDSPDRREAASQTVKKGFLHSAEFLAKNLDDTEYVKVLYRVFFGRPADAEGLASWVTVLGNGATRDKVADGFAKSQEFTEILLSHGL